MPDVLEVDLNDDGPHSIDVAAPSFQAAGGFEVVFRNHGSPLHVHLRLDGDLSGAATVSAANHYVDEGGVRNVRVRVAKDRLPVEGRLEIVTGYGSETAYVSVRIEEPGAVDPSVAVDERLGEPPQREANSSVAADHLPVLAIGLATLLTAVGAIVLVQDAVVLLLVLVAVLGVALAAGLVFA